MDKLNVVAYCRYSSDNQREESITAQKRAIDKYCKDNNYKLINVYADNAISGTGTDDRVEFNKMIDDSKKNKFSLVVVHKLDRFARNRYDSAIAKKKLKDNGVRVVSVLENLNGSPEAIITESILEGMAEYYSANLSREVKKGYNENVIQGKYCGGTIPLGLTKNIEGFYQIDEEKAKIVRKIFNMRSQNIPYIEISNYLKNEHNLNLGIQMLRNLFSNEKYIGILKHGKAINEQGIPPIIDLELFYRVQEVRKTRTPTKIETGEDRIYYLTGLFTCGVCGAPISGGRVQVSRVGIRHYYYKCSVRSNQGKCSLFPINKDKMEPFILEFIKNSILSDETLNNITTKISENLKNNEGTQQEIKSLNNDIARLNLRKKKLLDFYLDGNIDKAAYTTSESEINLSIKIITNKIEKLEFVPNIQDPEKIKQYLLNLRQDLDKNDPQILKSIINTFINEIKLDNENITINYSITNGITEESLKATFHRTIFKNYRTR